MNELTQKWLQALRSNQYQQTKGRLKDETGFCCLGVLCDVYDNSKWDTTTNVSYHNFDFFHIFPPPEVWEATGITSFSPSTLSDLNDSGDNTFSQIADYIEERLDPYSHRHTLDTAPDSGAEPEPAA